MTTIWSEKIFRMKTRTKPAKSAPIAPPEFYRFRHRHEFVRDAERGLAWQKPLWIVGASPFEAAAYAEEGYVVHTGKPYFVARWTKGEAGTGSRNLNGHTHHFYDEDLDILVYEVSWLDGEPADGIDDWLFEATCAVAYSLGEICELEPARN